LTVNVVYVLRIILQNKWLSGHFALITDDDDDDDDEIYFLHFRYWNS